MRAVYLLCKLVRASQKSVVISVLLADRHPQLGEARAMVLVHDDQLAINDGAPAGQQLAGQADWSVLGTPIVTVASEGACAGESLEAGPRSGFQGRLG